MQLRPIDQPDGPANEFNYYHCVVSGLPFDLPMNQVVELISPNGEEAPQLIALREELRYVLVPHQLHVFKEKLPKKFAMVTYFLQPIPSAVPAESEVCGAPPAALLIENKTTVAALSEEARTAIEARRAKAHTLVVDYFTNGAHSLALTPPEPGTASPAVIGAAADAMKEVAFAFCQPKELLNAVPFLASLDAAVELLKKGDCADVKKLRTWMLSKAACAGAAAGSSFGPAAADALFVHSNADGSSASSDAAVSRHYGSIASASITAVEWAWLRTQHRHFPQSATADSITAFFVKSFHPYFTYKDTIVVA